MTFQCPYIRRAIETLPSGYDSSNSQILAEAIRVNLKDSKERGLSWQEATRRVVLMIKQEFVNLKIVSPFIIITPSNFSVWQVSVQHPVGKPLFITQSS